MKYTTWDSAPKYDFSRKLTLTLEGSNAFPLPEADDGVDP